MKHLGDITKINGAEVKEINLGGRKYAITTSAKIYKENGKELRQYISKDGYAYIAVFDGIKRKKHRVHRLVAQTFLSNPCKLPQVNHIDGNKLNNNVYNLEWVTAGENQYHSRYVLHNKTGFADTPIVCIETNTKYKSTRDAWRKTGINYSHISECVNEKRKTAGGYHWRKE